MNCAAISDMHHLQRAWECSILPLLVPSVNLMHRQSNQNRMLAHIHNFKIGSNRKKETIFLKCLHKPLRKRRNEKEIKIMFI